jgi:aspartate racemase
MKMIGLIGGMSWESSAVYYRRLNEQIRASLGGLHSAELILRSVDFAEIVILQKAGDWQRASAILCRIANDLEAAGADCILICTNTMHKLADEVQDAIRIPLLNIIDITATAVTSARMSRPLLLATNYTMQEEFYTGRLRTRHALVPLVPDADDRARVHTIIFDELCRGRICEQSRQEFIDIVAKGCDAGADSVILGCTEIGLLIGPEHLTVPTFDSTLLHADAAAAFSCDLTPICRASPSPAVASYLDPATARDPASSRPCRYF